MLGGYESDPLQFEMADLPAGFGMDDLPLDVSVIHRLACLVLDQFPIFRGWTFVSSAAFFFVVQKPDVSKMGYNPANFAYWIGEEPWVPGYSVYYAISFYDARTNVESERSAWWGPKSDPKKLYGGFGLIRIPTDPTGRATGLRIWRKFAGQPEKLIYEIPDNVTTKYQDDVR